jgi:hypothetical protein
VHRDVLTAEVVGLALGPRRQGGGHLIRALARLLAPEVAVRCRAVARRAGGRDGLEVAADWVEELAAVAAAGSYSDRGAVATGSLTGG